MNQDPTSQNFPKLPTAADDLNGDQRSLSDKQCAGIELLAEGKNSGQVARQLGVDRRTVYTWRQKPLFRRALAERRRQLWGEVSARLRGMVHPSLDELERQLFERYDRARFRAATTILRLADVKNCPQPDDDDE